jgi:hypothetical protein
MHQTKKGNQWYFGMNVHIGVENESGLILSVESTAANVHDLTPVAELLHSEEKVVDADAGFRLRGLLQNRCKVNVLAALYPNHGSSQVVMQFVIRGVVCPLNGK